MTHIHVEKKEKDTKMDRRKKKNPWKKELDKTLMEIKAASRELSLLNHTLRKKILLDVASELKKKSKLIIRENKKDLGQARKDGLSSAMIDRLCINEGRIRQMAEGVKTVAHLKDPIGRVRAEWERPNGLKIKSVSIPIGVILIIYESRPNVTVECASLCFKSGNAVLLRGGKEAVYSNHILASVFVDSLKRHKVHPASVSILQTVDREAVDYLLERDQEINLVIPRGGKSLIQKVVAHSRIPVIKHYQGVCHVFVDRDANLKKAVAIAHNAKMHRTGVCNAMETLLVHEAIASRFLPVLGEKLKEDQCEVRGDQATCKLIPWAKKAKKNDYGQEFLDKILAIRVVHDLQEAITHIQDYGSGHTDAIVTENSKAAQGFAQAVDSSSVMINASTRFADGFEYGFGAEIGISTDKIHARGPMGLEGLTSYKYIVQGSGQIRK